MGRELIFGDFMLMALREELIDMNYMMTWLAGSITDLEAAEELDRLIEIRKVVKVKI